MGIVLALILIAIVWFLVDKYFLNYWKRLGFEQLEPSFFFGNNQKLVSRSASIAEVFDEFYYKSKGQKFVGFYNFYKPALLVNDPELVYNIFTRDFGYFHDHAIEFDTENDPLSGILFSLTGQKWRDLRVKLSPTFTSGKLKWMFPVMKQSSDILVEFIQNSLDRNETVIGFSELFRRVNGNIIASVAFGIDNDCINDPNNDFYINGMKAFENTFRNNLMQFLFQFSPKGMKLLKIKFLPKEVDDFFMRIIREIVDYREKNSYKRNDFMDLLIQLKNQGYVSADKDNLNDDDVDVNANAVPNVEYETNQNILKRITNNELAAQAFAFFLAAFETTSTAMTFCLIELARNPEIQRKVQQEVDEALAGKDVTYEALTKLKYLECCIHESLRIFPPVIILSRECTMTYKIPNSNLVIPKGTNIKIPIMSMHRDPEVYDKPLVFKPERFLDSPTGNSKLSDQKGVVFYSPFGDGPRSCIGTRMAKVSMKLVLASLLSNFTFSLDDEKLYNENIKFDKQNLFTLKPDHDVKFKITSRRN